MDILKQTLLQNVPSNSRSSRKCISFNCPCCLYMGEPRPDVKGRGGLFIENGEIGYNCFNCGFKFRQKEDEELSFKTKKFMELLGVPSIDINKVQLAFMKSRYAGGLLDDIVDSKSQNKNSNSVNNINFIECELPSNTHYIKDIIMDSDPESDVFKAYNYAQERNIANWPHLMWSESKNHFLNKRLIIPYLYNGKIVGYTARAFIDNISKDNRYYTHNPNGNKYLFNIDALFKNRKYVIVNESPIDSLLFDGIATMNFSPTREQLDIVNSFNCEKILVPDLNNSAGKKFIETAIDNSWSVFFPDWESNLDLGEATNKYGKLFVISNIINNRIKSPMRIKVKSKIY